MKTLAPLPPAPRPGMLELAVTDALRVLEGRPPDLILLNDPQRATDSAAVLAELAKRVELARTGLLVAAGSHRFRENERLLLERGLPPAGSGRPAWHDADAPDLVRIGGAAGWRAHPRLAAAERILAIGSVEPHYFAGFSGAHKTATIGCAARADITRNHAAALDPACRPARLEGNPVHAGIMAMLEALEAGRRVAAVNLMQLGAVIARAAGGTPRAALATLIPDVTAAYRRRIPRPAAGLIAEVTGPLACSFYQAEKGIKNSEAAVRDGGAVVLVAACPEGIGQAAFTELLRRARTHGDAVALLREQGYRLGDHKAVRLRRLTDPAVRNVRLYAVSAGLTDADAALLGLRLARSVGDALAAAGLSEGDPDLYRIEDAANTVVETDPA